MQSGLIKYLKAIWVMIDWARTRSQAFWTPYPTFALILPSVLLRMLEFSCSSALVCASFGTDQDILHSQKYLFWAILDQESLDVTQQYVALITVLSSYFLVL
jgi:hypothetical protein